MLPEFPIIKDFKYDLVAKFNEYKMFVTCESIMSFPSAKVFEGMACQTALLCADLECNKEFGLEAGKNCIMFEPYNINDFKDKVEFYQASKELASLFFSENLGNSLDEINTSFSNIREVAYQINSIELYKDLNLRGDIRYEDFVANLGSNIDLILRKADQFK
jgi:hypothetical protein